VRGFDSVEEAIEDIKQGKMVIVVDDADRENEGDFILAADKVTPEAVNFMAKYGRGLICAPMMGERLDELGLGPMVSDNTARLGTPFTISVDGKHNTTTGSSAGHHRGPHRSQGQAHRSGAPRPYLPPEGDGGWCPETGRPHRSGGRSCPTGRALSGGCAL